VPDPVVHFEIPAADVVRSRAFYERCFSWKALSMPGMGYTMFHTAPTDDKGMLQQRGAVNGGMFQRQGGLDRLLITIQVPDLDAALRTVQKEGGSVVRGRAEVPGVGFTAYVKDIDGNLLGLIQPTRKD